MNGRRALVVLLTAALLTVAPLGGRPEVALGAPSAGLVGPVDLRPLQGGGFQIDAPEVVVPGQPVEIGVTATSTVQDSQAGSITISLPGNPAVEVIGSTGPTTVWQPGQTMYHFGQGGQVPIGNRTVELFANPWGAGTTHSLRIRLTPRGPVTFQARATFRSASRGFVHLPGGGAPDQQGAPSRVVELGTRQAPEPEPEPEPEPAAPEPVVPAAEPAPPTPAPTAVPPTQAPPTAAPTAVPPTPIPPTPIAPTAAPTEAPSSAIVPAEPAQEAKPTGEAAVLATQAAAPPAVAPPTPAQPTPAQPTPAPTVPATADPRVSAASEPAGAESSRLPLIVGGLALLGFGVALGLVALVLSMRRRRADQREHADPRRAVSDPSPDFSTASYAEASPLLAGGPAIGDDAPAHWGAPAHAATASGPDWSPAPSGTVPSDEQPDGRSFPGAPIPWAGGGAARSLQLPNQPSETPTFVGLRAPVERYQERSLVGRGGMGSVYRAFDTRLRRWVALKILHSDLSGQQEFVDRFLREAQLAAMLQHPNIVTIFDVEQLDEAVRLVMAWVDGEDLQRVLEREGPMPPERAADVLDQLASALDHAHTQPIPVLHRDVKPSNVMLGRGDRVVLTDFGVARLAGDVTFTQAGQLVGTPAYMAPELVQGADADRRTDLYSLGVVLYQMLTRRPPFRAETPLAVLHAQLNVPPPPPSTFVPSLPAAVDRVLMTALEKDPNHRYQTASQLAREFRAALTEPREPTSAPEPSTRAPASEPEALLAGFGDERPAPDRAPDDSSQEASVGSRDASRPG